jgi:hypothetical protein
MGVRVDQARRDEGAAEVLHMVDIDDVVDDAGDTLRELRCPPYPGYAVVVHEDRGIAAYIITGPQPADVGQQANGHRITASMSGRGQRTATRLIPGTKLAGSAVCPDIIGGLLLSSARVVR